MSVETLIISFSYIAIFLLLVINGFSGFPSSQLIYVVAGFYAFKQQLSIPLIIIVGTIAMTIGNLILYELSRRKGLEYISKFSFFPPKEIKKVDAIMRKKGLWFLFFGKFVNPIKIVIPIPAGIAKINRLAFTLIVAFTTLIWALIFTLGGFYLGESFAVAWYYAVFMIIFAGIIMLTFYKYMNSKEILAEVNSKNKSTSN